MKEEKEKEKTVKLCGVWGFSIQMMEGEGKALSTFFSFSFATLVTLQFVAI